MDLLERESQWQQLDAAIKNVQHGRGAIALISGEAGIGKTTFVTAIADANRLAMRVMWGACDPLFTPRPLGPIYDIAVSHLSYLLDLLLDSCILKKAPKN